jgi:hypothetical protein
MIPLIKRFIRQSAIALTLVTGSGQILTSFAQAFQANFLSLSVGNTFCHHDQHLPTLP